MSNTGRNERNLWLRKQPGGLEVLDAIEDINAMERALKRRAANGDAIAAEKISVATIAMDRLEEIRGAMLAGYERKT